MPDGTALFLPATLPGERVLADDIGKRGDGRAGTVAQVLEPSGDRVAPPCPHFGTCGGCVLQHWRDAPYLAWKGELLDAALRRAGFSPTIGAVATTPPGGRRRMDLAVRRIGSAVVIGLHEAGSEAIVDIASCTVLDPALVALIAPLRQVLRSISGLRREGSAIVNLLDNGPDILFRGEAALRTADRTALTSFATAHGAPRISWAVGTGAPETACLLRTPVVTLSGVAVSPPPGAFLQASRSGEAAITAAVLAGLPERITAKTRVAEFYAGIGTLTFALAPYVRVDAFERDAASAEALRRAANAAGLAGRISVGPRDLAVRPMLAKELAPYAAVILDPPHAGAAAQIAEIARSGARRVIYVSCNPATLGRDASVLQAAGFSLLAANAVDQFRWSARLESVCVFERP